MKELDILHEIGDYWVCKIGKLFCVMKSGITHSTMQDAVGYPDVSLAIARANYLNSRDVLKLKRALHEALEDTPGWIDTAKDALNISKMP